MVRWKNRNGNAMIAGARLPRGARAGDGTIFHVTAECGAAECHQQQVLKNIFSAARIITDFVISSRLWRCRDCSGCRPHNHKHPVYCDQT